MSAGKSRCEECRAANKGHTLRRNYGLSLAKYKEMLAEQNGRCKLCGSSTPGGRGDWKVDHSHKTGKVRGLLCQGCNVGLGMFRDDIALLDLAKTYLALHGD